MGNSGDKFPKLRRDISRQWLGRAPTPQQEGRNRNIGSQYFLMPMGETNDTLLKFDVRVLRLTRDFVGDTPQVPAVNEESEVRLTRYRELSDSFWEFDSYDHTATGESEIARRSSKSSMNASHLSRPIRIEQYAAAIAEKAASTDSRSSMNPSASFGTDFP